MQSVNLLDAILRSVGIEYDAVLATPDGSLQSPHRTAVAPAKPVFQFNPFPITLDANNYKDPRSDSNPGGDLRSLAAFRQLVDPVPNFSHYYSAGTKSTEKIYGAIVEGLSVTGDSPFTLQMINEAKEQFHQGSFANMDGTPGQWRPVYALPEDWWDTSQSGRYKELDFDLSDRKALNGSFTVIDGPDDLQLSAGKGPGASAPLAPDTKIKSITMKYLLVQLHRPWLNFSLFELSGWFLSGQPQGWCSSGKADENSGVIPLLPTGMLLAKDISIDAEWGRADQAFLESANASRQPVFLGPLALQPQSSASSLQVIGWISSLVPYSPRESDLRPGSILVTNKGAFVSRFSVAWQQSGQLTANESGSFPVLAAKNISIPPDARNISVKIEIMTFPAPVETWRTVATYEFDTPVRKSFQLSGETWSPVIEEIGFR